MSQAEAAPLADRRARIAAACVNLAPALVPLIPWFANDGSEPGYGALGYWAWSVAALLIVLVTNTVLLLWRRQSLGLAYLGLAYEGGSAGRMLLGKLVVWGLPWLTVPLILFPLAGLANWLIWLGPERRTLADLVGACRVVERHDFRAPGLLLELLMLGPLVVFLPAYAQLPGGAMGGVVAIMLVVGVMVWKRVAWTSERGHFGDQRR
jgi:hypothetical protein